MATDKYSKAARPRATRRFATLTDAHVTIKPRFCVALIALALAGGSAGPSFAQSMSGGGAESQRQPHHPGSHPRRRLEGLANVLRPSNPASTPA